MAFRGQKPKKKALSGKTRLFVDRNQKKESSVRENMAFRGQKQKTTALSGKTRLFVDRNQKRKLCPEKHGFSWTEKTGEP